MQLHDPDQQRAATNLENAYSAWIDADWQTQGYYLRWKTVNNKDYLCRVRRGTNNETSLGPRSPETEKMYDDYKQIESIAQNGEKRLLILGPIYKATQLPVIETFAGKVLRALDRHQLLGNKIQVIGTNAIVAYQMEAQCSVDQELMQTEDFDLVWRGMLPLP